MLPNLEKEKFKQFVPPTAPTVTFTGDRRLLFSRSAMRRMGGQMKAVQVFFSATLGVLAFVPTVDEDPTGLRFAARGEERKPNGIYAKRLSIAGTVSRLLEPFYSWETLNGNSYLLEKTILSIRRNGQSAVAYVVNLTVPVKGI